ncbi:MAG: M20/M25/M40 family metallo-hydrolase [Acidobacteria bacterium]|nr:M20/M25/M40 family metallo-hydrolase [Acidobacteriota bacterium]
MTRYLMLGVCLLLPLAAQESDPLWITLGKDKAYALLEWLGAHNEEPPEWVYESDEVVILMANHQHVEQLAVMMHEKFDRCGGFFVHTSLDEAAQFSQNADPFQEQKAIAYTINNGAVVNTLLSGVSEANIRSTISSLASFKNRYYTAQTGVDGSNWIYNQWASLIQGLSYANVVKYNHTWAQPSVILTIEGSSQPNEVVILGSHLDSIGSGGASATAPGADDDASGIATLTEIIRRAVATGYRPAKTVKFIGYAAEEVGLRGSQAIATDYQNQGINVIGVVQFDMTNYAGSSSDIWIYQDYTNAAQNQFLIDLIQTYTSYTTGTSNCGYGCSDHASWHNRGYAASMPFEAKFGEHNPSIHTANDTLANSGGNANHSVKFCKLGLAYMAELAKGNTGGGCSPNPTANAGPDVSICPGNSVTIGTAAQSGHSYSWSPGGATSAQISVSPNSTTTYTVTATTACGSAQDSVLVNIGGGSGNYTENFDSGTGGFTASGLWHRVTNSACVSPANTTAPGAYYYGQDNSCNYSTGGRTQGSLTSPVISGIQANSVLRFDYYRQVESYASGSYDKTWVEVIGNSTSTVWSRDSKNASSTAWANSGDISLAAFAGQNVQIRFNFDSVDGSANNFKGWFIDSIVVTRGSPCQSNQSPSVSILQPSNGSVFSPGQTITFQASASDPEDGNLSSSVVWTSNRDGNLGTGASIQRSLSQSSHTITATVTDSQGASTQTQISVQVQPCSPAPIANAGPDQTTCGNSSVTLGTPAQSGHTYLWQPGGYTTAQITVTPTGSTAYTVTATTACGSASDTVFVEVLADAGSPFFDNFESGSSLWTATGLWHMVNNSGCAPAPTSPTHAFYYGEDSDCQYSTGSTTTGTLTSIEINGITGSSVLNFDYFRQVESANGSYDRTEVLVSLANGSTSTVWSRDSRNASSTSWQNSGDISLASYAGQTIRLIFRFNSVDNYANGYTGWLIDNVWVTGDSPCN